MNKFYVYTGCEDTFNDLIRKLIAAGYNVPKYLIYDGPSTAVVFNDGKFYTTTSESGAVGKIYCGENINYFVTMVKQECPILNLEDNKFTLLALEAFKEYALQRCVGGVHSVLCQEANIFSKILSEMILKSK